MADDKANDTNHIDAERPVDATTNNPAQESLDRNQPVRSTTSRDASGNTAESQKANAQLKQEDAKAQEKHAKVEQGRQKKDEKAQKVSEKADHLADKAKDKVDNLASSVQEKTSRASDKADEKADETHRKVEEGREERREQVSEAHRSSDEDLRRYGSREEERHDHSASDDGREAQEDDSEGDGLDDVVSEHLEVVSKGDVYEVTYLQNLGDGVVKQAHFTTTGEHQTYYDVLGESRKRVRNEKAQRLESRGGHDNLESRDDDSPRFGVGTDSDYRNQSSSKDDEGRSGGREDGRDSSYPSSLRGAFSKLFEVFGVADNERDSSRSSGERCSCHCGDNEPLTRSQYENDRRRFAEVADAHRKPAHMAYDMLEENNRLLKQIAQHLNVDDSDLR